MKIYDGGSSEDKQLFPSEDDQLFPLPGPLLIQPSGSQVFIEFLANGNGVGKGFSASIKFGKIINKFLQSRNFI